MAYLAQCAPERIPLTLLDGALYYESERRAALLALSEVSLVRHDPFADGTPAVTVHRLVQAVARARAATKDAAQQAAPGLIARMVRCVVGARTKANSIMPPAAARLFSRLASIYPDDDNPTSWPLCAQLTPHLLALHDAVRVDAASWSALLNRVGRYFYGRADHAQAEPCFREALAIDEKARGPQHPSTATSLSYLALVRRDQGDLAAQPLFERALVIREKALGPEHPDTASSSNNLALVLRTKAISPRRNRSSSARWAIDEKARGPEHPDTAMSLNNPRSVLQDQGDLAAAQPLFERALAIREEARGPEHPSIPRQASTTSRPCFGIKDDLAAARPAFERWDGDL